MGQLSSENIKITDEFSFKINGADDGNCRIFGSVMIVFVDKKFDRVDFASRGSYTRLDWETLHSVREEILKIEDQFKKENKPK